MEINGLSKRQCQIADALWQCDSSEEVDDVINEYGSDAELVRELILAAAIDDSVADQTGFPDVDKLLSKFR